MGGGLGWDWGWGGGDLKLIKGEKVICCYLLKSLKKKFLNFTIKHFSETKLTRRWFFFFNRPQLTTVRPKSTCSNLPQASLHFRALNDVSPRRNEVNQV